MAELESWVELELPVLRWVREHPRGSLDELEYLKDKTSAALPPLTDAQVHEALGRLKQHGLIDGHVAQADVAWWNGLRVTADGLRALGEWPPVDAAAVNVTLARLLRDLAGHADSDEDATATRRAGTAVSKMSADIVRDVVTGRLRELGQDLTS